MPDTKRIYPDGFYVEKPREGAPQHIWGRVSVKVAQAIPWLEQHQNNGGYVNLELKESVGGNLYLELDSWQPTPKPADPGPVPLNGIEYPEEVNEDIPF